MGKYTDKNWKKSQSGGNTEGGGERRIERGREKELKKERERGLRGTATIEKLNQVGAATSPINSAPSYSELRFRTSDVDCDCDCILWTAAHFS